MNTELFPVWTGGNVCFFLMFDCKMKKGSSTNISSLCHIMYLDHLTDPGSVCCNTNNQAGSESAQYHITINKQAVDILTFSPTFPIMHLDTSATSFNLSSTWGQFVLDETERDERGAKPEAKGVPKSPPKRGLITSTRRRRRRHGRHQMANICILIDLVSSLLLSSLHVFRDH